MARPRRRRVDGARRGMSAGRPAGRSVPLAAGTERLEPRLLLATLFWDPDRVAGNNVPLTGAGLGGRGVWSEGGAAVWFDPALYGGRGGHVAWNSTRRDTAVFAGPVGGAVTVGGRVAAAGVEFRGGSYIVQGGELSTTGGMTTFTAHVAATVNSPITGTGGVVKNGVATLTLGASRHSYTGDTIAAAGTLDVRGTIESHVRPRGGGVRGVMFNDPQLAAAVREALALDAAVVLTPAVLAQSPSLRSLTLDGNRVGDLTGIAALSALESLALVPGDVALVADGLASLAPLAALGGLASLTLQHVGLTDAALATLPQLPGLVALDVRFNALATVPASVAAQPRLATLLVHGNPAVNDSPRTALATLRGRTVDVDIMPDRPDAATGIADLAARLYHLPVKMLEYVTNAVAFQPYAGAMKGPLATLQTAAGNDWDTNSLLAELLGAAGIATRFVSGAIEITTDQLRAYVGVRDTAAAGTILAQAGLRVDESPNRLRRTWIEALVRQPSATVAAWVPLDAAWKFRDFRPGLPGVLGEVPFSPLEAGYLTGPEWRSRSAGEYYEAQVAGWLATNRPDLTTADVAYDGPIIQQSFTVLPASLPYAVLATQVERPAMIPAAARHVVRIALASGATPLFGPVGVEMNVADVALSRLTIDPGLDVAGAARPVLRRDGVAVATSPFSIPAADAVSLTLTVSITAPAGGGTVSRSFIRMADRCIAIGLDANQLNERSLVEKRAVVNAEQLNQANGLPVDHDRAVGGLLDLAIASFFVGTAVEEASIAGLTAAVPDRSVVALGIATSAPRLAVLPAAGLQFPYLPLDLGIDVPANHWFAIGIDAEPATVAAARDVLLGCMNSALEGLVIEELTNFESVSTMKAFQVAAAAGGLGQLVEINVGNAGLVHSLLPGVRPEIRQAIAATVTGGIAGVPEYAGFTFAALVPRSEITVGGGTADLQWKGVGYTLKGVTADPARAADNGRTVGYIIHGSVAGQPVRSFGGAASRFAVRSPVVKPTVPANSVDNYHGDPVNVANGNVYHDETDVDIPNAGVPLAFRRRYDSIHTVSGLPGSPAIWSDRGLGEGWSFTYSDRLEIGAHGLVTWFTDDGSRLEFQSWHPPYVVPIAGEYVLPMGVFGGLSGFPATGFTWTDMDGGTRTFGPAVNGVCPLLTTRDRFGNGVRIDLVPGTARPLRVSDARDPVRWLAFTYAADAPARIVGLTDFTGRTWSYGHSAGRLATVTSPSPAPGVAGAVVRYAYHADAARRGLLAAVTDPLGNVTSWDYYASRRGFRVTDAEGNRHSFSYNLHRRRSAFIDERGGVSLFAYDDYGNLIERRHADRTVERSTWSHRGPRLSTTDAHGRTERQHHDAFGKITSATDRLGRTTTYAYRPGGFRELETVVATHATDDPADDVVTRFVHDAAGFLTARIDDAGSGRLNLETRFEPAAGGRGFVAAATSPAGVVTRFTSNAAGQVLTRSIDVSPGVAATDRFAYDARGNLVSATDANGHVTMFTFDAVGRRVSQTQPDPDGPGPLPALSATHRYDAAGNLVSTSLQNGRTTRFSFDRMQRPVRTVRPDGTYAIAMHDVAGTLVSETDFAGRATRFVHDGRNRRVGIVHADGATERTRYDGGGRVTARTDPAGGTTTFAYDVLDRLVAETAPSPAPGVAGAVTRHGYDSRGNPAFVTGPLGAAPGDPAHTTSHEHDAVGRRIRQTLPDPDGDGPLARPVTSYVFDRAGNVVSLTDPRGFTTTFGHDPAGRVVATTGPDPDGAGPLPAATTRFVYDLAGNLRFEIGPGGTTQHDASFTTERVYDALNREVRRVMPDPDGVAGPQARPVTSRSYDLHGQLSVETDARGGTTSFVRDSLGRVLVVVDPAGAVTTTVSDAVGNAVVVVDPLGRRTVTTFDRRDRPVLVQAPRPASGATTPFTAHRYDVVGNRVATVDPTGRTTWRQYDRLGRVVGETDALGIAAGDPQHTTRTEYDASGRVVAVVDPLGRRTEQVHDNLGRLIRTETADAARGRPTTHRGYDAAGNLRYVTDPRGAVAGDPAFTTWMFYDAVGRRTAVVDPLGPDWSVTAVPESLPAGVTNVTLSTYDAAGNLSGVADPLGRRTDFAHDHLGRRISETLAAAQPGGPRPVTRYAYDAAGNRTSVTDPLGFVTTFAHDSLGRRTVVTDPRGFATRTTYDAIGNTVGVTDASGNVTRYAHDRLNRLVAETDPLGAVTTHAYDAAGNKIRETDRNGRVTTFVRDAAGRLVEERWQASASAPVGRTIRRFLDAAGQVVGVVETDSANPSATTRWQFDHDASGNVVRSRMAPGELLQVPALAAVPNPPGGLAAGDPLVDWDADGRAERYDVYQVPLVAGEQLVLVATSSAFDPVLLVQRPSGGITTMLADDDGFGGTGAWLRVVADVEGTWMIAVTSRAEDAAGAYELSIVKDHNPFVPQALVEHDFAYDKANGLTTAVEDQAAVAGLVGLGRVATGLGVRTDRVRDGMGRVTRIEQSTAAGAVAKRVDVAHRADGGVAAVTRFGGPGTNPVATTVHEHDGLGRLTRIVHSPLVGSAATYGYSFDAASRITSFTSPEGTSTFGLDAADQLLSASLTGEAYSYDRTGNRSAAGVVVGPGNRLLSDGVFRYDHDREGNRTARYRDVDRSGTLTADDADVTIHVWDQRNRLVAVSQVATWTAAAVAAAVPAAAAVPGSVLELRYTYDAFDRRIRRAIDADGAGPAGWEVSFAAYEGDLRTLEIRQSATVRDGAGRVVAMVGSVAERTLHGSGIDVVLAVDRIAAGGIATWWTLGDHQGSIRDLVAGTGVSAGRIMEHRQYDSFGRVVRRVVSPESRAVATAGVGVSVGYAGRPVEERTGLSDNRARWYDAATGRFVSEDPSGFRGGDANLFRYAANDPLSRTDPSGLAARWAQQAARSSVPPAGFAGLTGPALTTSSVAPLQPRSSTSSQTLTVAPSNGQRPTHPQAQTAPFAHLMVTGRAAPPVPRPATTPQPERWTLTDREAAMRAEVSYFFSGGGLLRDLDLGYDGKDETNRFTVNGLSAMLTRSPITGTYYLAFRGTESIFNWADVRADLRQGVGFNEQQFDMAIRLTALVKRKLGADADIVLTGHSLGGGLAAAAAHAHSLNAIIFNPASLNSIYAQGKPGRIRSHVIAADFLSLGRIVLGRTAPGEIIVHPPRTAIPLMQHGMSNFPDY